LEPRTVTLADGSRVLIRPIAPEDRDELVAGFERLSAESRYRRFFGPMVRLSERDLDRLTQVDHHDHEALVAIDAGSGRGVAVARFIRTQDDEAEPAVTVTDDWQRRGLAGRLLALLAERALEEGIERFRAPVLAHNTAAMAVLRQLGETGTTHQGREVELEIRLTETPRRDLLTVLREVAAGTLEPARTLLRWGVSVSSARMPDADDPFDRLSSAELHDLAISHARRHLDVRFFWELLKVLPAAEAGAGELDEAQADVMSLSGHVDDLTESGRGEVAELLRPFYLDYLRRHEVEPA